MTCLQEQNRGAPQVGAHLMVQPLASFPSGAPGPFPSRPHPRQDTDTLCLSGYRATSKGLCNSDHEKNRLMNSLTSVSLKETLGQLVAALHPIPHPHPYHASFTQNFCRSLLRVGLKTPLALSQGPSGLLSPHLPPLCIAGFSPTLSLTVATTN